MAKKVPVDQLASEIEAIFKEYQEETYKDVQGVVKQVCMKGAGALKSSSSRFGAGYANSWSYKVENERLEVRGTIYSRVPGLPHLLEHGHAKRGGGRVPGNPHIAPVEEQLVEEFEKGIKSAL